MLQISIVIILNIDYDVNKSISFRFRFISTPTRQQANLTSPVRLLHVMTEISRS